MKTHEHYRTLSAIKQMTELIGHMVGDTVKSQKIRRFIIRGAKRVYCQSRPKRTRCVYEN
jgi:hypothetical protein